MLLHRLLCVRTGSWTGPPRGERAPRVLEGPALGEKGSKGPGGPALGKKGSKDRVLDGPASAI